MVNWGPRLDFPQAGDERKKEGEGETKSRRKKEKKRKSPFLAKHHLKTSEK